MSTKKQVLFMEFIQTLEKIRKASENIFALSFIFLVEA